VTVDIACNFWFRQ